MSIWLYKMVSIKEIIWYEQIHTNRVFFKDTYGRIMFYFPIFFTERSENFTLYFF